LLPQAERIGTCLSQLRPLLAQYSQLPIGRESKVHIFQDAAATPPSPTG